MNMIRFSFPYKQYTEKDNEKNNYRAHHVDHNRTYRTGLADLQG